MYPVLSRKIVHPGKGSFHLVSEQVELPNGKHTEHLTVEHNGAVVILPLTEKGEIVMIRQYRHSVKRELFELPAGTLKIGEDPLECAHREICEETGYGAKSLTEAGILYPAPGFCSEKQFLFVASELYPKTLPCDEDEDIRVEIISPAQFLKCLETGEICDAKTISLFFLAQMKGFINQF